MTFESRIQAEIAAEAAGVLLTEAQLAASKDSAQELAVIAKGYASLATAHQLADLTEAVEALTERMKELVDVVAATARRTPWWRTLLSWRTGREPATGTFSDEDVTEGLTLAANEDLIPAAAQQTVLGEADQAADDEGLASVITLPFAGGAR